MNSLSSNIANVLSIARLAPSVHNTQPWKVDVIDDGIIILLDDSHKLIYGDPTGRETILSLGIFTEACVLALNANGYHVSKVSEEEPGRIVLQVKERPKLATSADVKQQVGALESRFSDRSIYEKVPIESKIIQSIEAAWNSDNVKIKVVTDIEVINRSADLTEKGLLLAMSSPDFRRELSHYLVPNNKQPYGIPLPSLGIGKLQAFISKLLIESGLTRKHEAHLEKLRWDSASGLVFILSKGDSPAYWLECGRAYLRASLAIEQASLRQATSAAIVEASDFHEDIEKLLGTNERIECLLRIGKSTAKPYHSGRYEPEKLLVTSNQ